MAPAELEDVLRGLTGVKDVAVIGVKSAREGEVPRAFIVREEQLTEAAVHEFMSAQVSAHKQLAGGIRVAVRDTGYGISQAVIDGVAAGRVESRSIGLMNVHQRVKLLYGDGLHLKRLEPGTEVCFYLPDQEAMPC